MNNFEFRNPTKIIFGKGSIAQLSKELPKGKKIMVNFGGGSVKKNGIYDQVMAAMKGMDFIEFWGIEPNPTVQSVREAVKIAKSEDVEFFLAVGGGSTIDATKVIAAATISDKDAWEIVLSGQYAEESAPIATVLTLPATGSEMNRGAVITNAETKEKFVVYTYHPQFSILDPEATYSLPSYQIACGLADTFIHIMEQYLTKSGISPLMDRWAEGVLLTIKESAPKILEDKSNYDNMSNFMLSATMALNGFVSMGVPQDWATHRIGHEITALTSLTHGHTLTVILPALMSIMREQKKDKILQYAERVWGITTGSDSEKVNAAIESTEKFFRSLGLKTRLFENGIGDDVIAQVVERFKERGTKLGEDANITYIEVAEILQLCK